MTTFDEYLMSKYIEAEHPLDDDIPDGFESWLVDQGVDEVIEWAEKWGSKRQGLEFEYVSTQEGVRKHIQNCEGRHTQQAVYSTFHDALTQVCYGCKKVRSSIRRSL